MEAASEEAASLTAASEEAASEDAASEEAASLEAASEEAASETAVVLAEAASEVEEAAAAEPQAVMPAARARATTAMQIFLSFISMISLFFLLSVLQRAFRCASLRCYILVRFCKKSRGFWSKIIIHVKNLHSCHKLSPKVKDFLAKIKLETAAHHCPPYSLLLQNVARQLTYHPAEGGMLWAQSKASAAGREAQNAEKMKNTHRNPFYCTTNVDNKGMARDGHPPEG